VFIGGKPIKNSLFLELKTFKDLKEIPQNWMLILEILTQEMGLRKVIKEDGHTSSLTS
jgi:hypothetical protein